MPGTEIGTPLGRHFRRSAAFAPSSIASYYREVRPGPQWCFQDAAGTIPSADGSTIQSVRDPFSNAIVATQTGVVGLRPTLVNYAGRWTIWTTGGQHLVLPNVQLPTAGTVGFAARRVGSLAYPNRWCPIVGPANDPWFIFESTTGYPGLMRNSRIEGTAAAPDCQTAAKQYMRRSSAATYDASCNGVTYLTGSPNHSTANADWSLGSRVGGGGIGQCHDGPFYGLLIYSALLSGADAANVLAYQTAQFS